MKLKLQLSKKWTKNDMEKGFWSKLNWPIIGLAPMDGVTDTPFRYITAKYGKPDVIFTEFTTTDGICAGAIKTLQTLVYDKSERPVVAQIFGVQPESFYKTAFVACELGFDGIDINMGCPAGNIASKGSGAGLILTPNIAKKIIIRTQKAIKDWAEGRTIEESGLPPDIIKQVKKIQPRVITRQIIPVSIKTRIGYNSIVIEEWVKHLLEVKPVNISIHGRTLKQMYTGTADWEAIARAAQLIHQTHTTILGNGDIKNTEEAAEKIKHYGVDGVLIGRAAFGNPWVFKNKEATVAEKLSVAIEHSHLFSKIFGDRLFMPMRKHLAWYCRGFPNASEIRQKLMQTKNAQEVETLLVQINKAIHT